MVHPLTIEEVNEAIEEQLHQLDDIILMIYRLHQVKDELENRDYYDSPVGINNQ